MTSLRDFLARAERKVVLAEVDPAADLLRRGILDRVVAVDPAAHHAGPADLDPDPGGTGVPDRGGPDPDSSDPGGPDPDSSDPDQDQVGRVVDFVALRLLAFGAGDDVTTQVRAAVDAVPRADLAPDHRLAVVLGAVDAALEPAGLSVRTVPREDGGSFFGLTTRARSTVGDRARRRPAPRRPERGAAGRAR